MSKRKKLERVGLKIDNLSVKKEFILAERIDSRHFIIRNIPAFVYGSAYGDEIELVGDAGEFRVYKRSGHITIRAFVPGVLNSVEVDQIINAVTDVGGLHEIGKNARSNDDSSLLLLSIPVSVGFPKIEVFMHSLEAIGAKWEYGNVYSDDGAPLNWW